MTGIDVAYRTDGTGPPVYMIHGIGSRKEHWNPFVAALSNRYTCVTYDLRGHGESPIPPTPYSLEQLVEDLEMLRKHHGHEQIHVIGHSLGGVIGPAYARAYADRVLSVGLISTAAGRTNEDREILFGVIDQLRKNGIPETFGKLANRWYTDAFMEAHPEVVETQMHRVLTTPEDVFLSVFEVYASSEMGPWLHEIKCPCLVLTAEFDGGSNPRLNQFIADELPNSELIIIPDLKHDILQEAPDLVIEHLRRFLTESA
jgi:3-oxoadipate enol-lactonase